MKKSIFLFLLSIAVTAVLSLGVLATETPPPPTGDPNLDGGGGGMGSGSEGNTWHGGDDGVRVSVMRGTQPVAVFDMANKDWSGTIENSFEKKCKLYYRNGGQPTITHGYTNTAVPDDLQMPRVVKGTGTSTIEAVRRYFSDSEVIHYIARKVGMDYEELVSGEYKLMLEPVAYFQYNQHWWAMTATECGAYNVIVSGDLRSRMPSLTHQNMPLSMFLERADLGIRAWTGPINGRQSDNDIVQTLGVGIVTFVPEDITPPPLEGDQIYRTDTDVITSVQVRNRSGSPLTPDNPGSVTFHILGREYTKNFICPSMSSQLVWVRWHTPSTPQNVKITVTRGRETIATIDAVVTDFTGEEPPNPVYDGPGIGAGQYIENLRPVRRPDWGTNAETTWSQWVARWIPGNPIIPTPGYWSFELAQYTAALTADLELVPGPRVPTAERRGDDWYMKAGYAVSISCSVAVSGDGNVSDYDITPVQNAIAVFPEFNYDTYLRFLAPEYPDSYYTVWELRPNMYSYYRDKVHFTPLWYPEGEYIVPVAVFDAWTPGGQLYTTAEDSVSIYGDLFDDWYIRVID